MEGSSDAGSVGRKTATASIARQLTLVVLLVGVSTLLIGGGVVAATNVGPWSFVMMLGGSTILVTCATWLASRRLVSGPILDLGEAVREVSTVQDYFARVTRPSNGEGGRLVDTINELLQRREERDQHSRGECDRLKSEVDVRTRELRESHARLKEATTDAIAADESKVRELRESNARLEAAKEHVIAAEESKRRFISNVAHEIRTPMNGVFGMAELLSNTGLTPQQHKFTRAVLDSAEDLLAIIDNFLDFSKVQAGKFEKIDNQPFSPRECIEKVSELLGVRAHLEGIELSHECANDVPEAMLGDGKRVRQVLTNLIGNAIKYTEVGTIVVRTSLVEHGANASTIRFEIADTGIGIPSYLHKDIFEAFSQADTSTTRQFGGAGLGLAISKHLVDLMDGEIGVVSEPGVGSNFWFTIQGELCPAAADPDLDGVRALIVAADAMSGDALRQQLTACGGTGIVVPSSQEAIAALGGEAGDRLQFDLVLIDTLALDGLALVRQIRADEATRSLPLVLVSNVARGKTALTEAGIDGSLVKPVRRAQLSACVTEVTGRSGASIPSGDQETVVSGFEEAEAGARILVAEDNAVNREVATTMLETLECRVDVALNGLQAVEAVQREEYDLVFLDCQMPKVDGYEAARQIRRLEQKCRVGSDRAVNRMGHLPIVAMTAHSAPTDRDRCLESGMDDYVSKPYTLQTLRDALRHWVGGRGESAMLPQSSANVHPESTATDGAPISETVLEPILELDRLNGGGVFARVVRIFLDTAPITLDSLRTAVREGDATGLARAAHELKSASLNVGAEPMAAVCKKLEAFGRKGTVDGAASLATRLDELYLEVKAALEARLDQDQPDDVVSV